MESRTPDLPTQLRGGHVTFDRRLDRLPRWDQQNEEYPIRAALTRAQVAKPRGYTWRVPIWLDQGQEGACVGFAWTHELAARPTVVPDLTPYHARDLYHECQRIDPWEGGSYPGALPFYEGTDVLSGAKILQSRGAFAEYRWATSVDDLALAVGYKGPAVLGVNWYTGMLEVDAAGYIHVTGSIAGGHAILCHAVNVRERFFTLWNSWGPDWGRGGTARVSFDDMERLLAEFGEACVPVRRRAMKE